LRDGTGNGLLEEFGVILLAEFVGFALTSFVFLPFSAKALRLLSFVIQLGLHFGNGLLGGKAGGLLGHAACTFGLLGGEPLGACAFLGEAAFGIELGLAELFLGNAFGFPVDGLLACGLLARSLLDLSFATDGLAAFGLLAFGLAAFGFLSRLARGFLRSASSDHRFLFGLDAGSPLGFELLLQQGKLSGLLQGGVVRDRGWWRRRDRRGGG
jgi:hypothetical protein